VSGTGPIDLEAEYNNRARVPEYPEIMAGWERDAAAYRQARRARSELGARYGTHPRQTVDLFHADQTPGEASTPLVVFIHGGYWRSLEPSLFSHLAAGANAHGFAVALPGYRLCPEVGIADIIADMRQAFLFLHRRWPDRPLVACGHSAGGHLAAAMAATDWGAEGAVGKAELVRHALAISGVFDLTPLLSTSMNADLRLDPAAAKAASPAFWPVPAGVHLQAWVGGEESAEFLRQSRLIADRWAAAGARTRFHAMPEANHFNAPNPLADPASELTETLIGVCAAATRRT
jgi:arylformamidase